MSESRSCSSSPSSQGLKSTSNLSKVLGFLRKRSGRYHAGRDGLKTIIVPAGLNVDLQPFESATKIQESIRRQGHDSNQLSRNGQLLGNAALKGVTRRKSLELACFIERLSSDNFNAAVESSHDSSLSEISAIHNQRPPLSGVPVRDDSEFTRSFMSTRRGPTFFFSLPWRLQSEYVRSSALPNQQSKLTKAQRKFVRAFPELADVTTIPAAYCATCTATTPEASSVSVSHSALFPSDTFTAQTSFDLSISMSSISILTCRGHFSYFSCALEREILWQGTLFITATHICFYGKHFGKSVRIIVEYGDLVSIDKEKKMGVFPNSVRMRVRTPPQHRCAGESQELKDYVFTSLISRERAHGDIVRNWCSHRQMMKNVSHPDSEPDQQLDSLGKHLARSISISDMKGLATRAESSHRQRSPTSRSDSFTSDKAPSSAEDVDRPGQHERLSSIRTTSPLPLAVSSTINGSQEDWEASTIRKTIFPGTCRESIASLASSSDKQIGNGIIGYLQRKHSNLRGSKWTSTPDRLLDTFSNDILHQETIPISAGDTESPSDHVSSASNAVDACLIQSEPCRMTTPSTTLISRPLMTTEVTQNLATSEPPRINSLPCMTYREPTTVSTTPTMMRSNSSSSSRSRYSQHNERRASVDMIDESMTPEYSRTTVPVNSTRTVLVTLPTGPVECGCTRHYKHSVISTVIPMPLEVCFELLFSGMGAGQGDKLGCDTHRCKDGSTDIKITPWHSPSSLKPADLIARKWSDEVRYLEYSVSFKVPILAKTSTACFETQQVIEYSDFVIVVHSESRTPNVPYGEHFSTVNQICMTWDSPGNTKIQCFTEVKFKKPTMWSGKIEAGSLEGSGGFYKELVRQLAELAASPQGTVLAKNTSKLNAKAMTATEVKLQWPAKAKPDTSSLDTVSAAASLQMEVVASSPSITNEPVTPVLIQDPIKHSPSSTALTMKPAEMSQAQALLSQQILESQDSPFTLSFPLKSEARASLESGSRLKFGGVSTNSNMLSTPEKKSPSYNFIQSIMSPMFPVLRDEQAAANFSTPTAAIESSSTKPSTPALSVTPPSAQTLLGLLKKSLMLFNIFSSATTSPISSQSMSIDASISLGDPRLTIIASPLTSVYSAHPRTLGNRVKFSSTSYHTRGASNSGRLHNTQASATKAPLDSTLYDIAAYQDRGSRLLSKPLSWFLVMGVAITALNVWHLFSIVSSILDVIYIKEELANHSIRTGHYIVPQRLSRTTSPMTGTINTDNRRRRAVPPECSAFQDDHAPPIRQSPLLSDQAPFLQGQTDILRAEIVELFGILEASRQELQSR